MDGIITVDENQIIVLMNPAAEKMFRCAAKEMMGPSRNRLILERYRALHETHIKKFGATGVSTRRMGAIGLVNGLRSEFPFDASISQVEIGGKKLYTVILRDVTERLSEVNMSNGKRPIPLIEGNPTDLDLTIESFKQHNVANPVTICRDGEEALDFITQHQDGNDSELPLLVLLDLRLPKVDGLEVLQHAHQFELWKKIPIVVLTTSREDKDVHRAYEIGGSSYIVKPVDFEKFADVTGPIKMYWLLTNEHAYPEKIK